MALLKAKAVVVSTGTSITTTTSVFEQGNYIPTRITVEISSSTSNSTTSSPPKPLLVVTPTTKGTYPVILFLHGFLLSNSSYSQLLHHIASHGYIVVAPQVYLRVFPPFIPIPSQNEEIEDAAKVTDWLFQGLQSQLPHNVEAKLKALALVGHSRGGKTAFSLALGYAQTTLKYSVLVGIDPVGGPRKYCQTDPKILSYEPQSFNISIPIAVIGTGLGCEKANFIAPPCAPDGVNHKEFFNECKPPCAYFVTKDYGHMDMFNDHPSGLVKAFSNLICKNGKGSRDPMRKSVGGIVVALLRAYLAGDFGDLLAIVHHPHDVAPVTLEPVCYRLLYNTFDKLSPYIVCEPIDIAH